jgi:hypothetical protein
MKSPQPHPNIALQLRADRLSAPRMRKPQTGFSILVGLQVGVALVVPDTRRRLNHAARVARPPLRYGLGPRPVRGVPVLPRPEFAVS